MLRLCKYTAVLTVISLAFALPTVQSADLKSASLYHVETISSSPGHIELEFRLSENSEQELLKEIETFNTYDIPNKGATYEYGRPILPAVSRYLVVPARTGLELVVQQDEPRYLNAAKPPVICMEGAPHEDNHDIYSLNGVYPPLTAEMSEPIVIRGVRLVKVSTYPIQYDPETQCYITHERIETEIRFTDDPPANPARLPVRRNRSREFLKYIRSLAFNCEQVGRDDPDRDVEPEYIGHYLIVTNENCLEYAISFIEWRRKAGYKMDILNIPDDIAQEDEVAVKALIQERYDDYLDAEIDPFDWILLIGDRTDYARGVQAQWILKPFEGDQTWGETNHADYLFACLEGDEDDRHPDVGISRWHSGTEDLMRLTVGRTLAYEAEPFMENTDWLTRGGVYTQNWGGWHVTIATNVRWSEEVLQHLGFDDVRFYEDMRDDAHGERIGPVMTDWFNDGLNVMAGRAQNYYWHWDFRGVDDNVVFPINFCHSGHGEWCAEMMTRTGDGEHLKGPVAMTYGWGNPHYTAPISACWMECVSAVMQKDISLGWGRILGITAIETYFSGAEDAILYNKTEFDCFGDPGIKPWIGVPRVLDCECPETITPENSMIEVLVFDPENNNAAVENAQVTFYTPGIIPENPEEYADYQDFYMKTKTTDAEGIARFMFDEEIELEGETAFVTVTGRDIRPIFKEIEIEEANRQIDIADYVLTEIDGNENNIINPGERFSISITAINRSDQQIENVTAVVRSLSPWVEIDGQGVISFGDIADGEESNGDQSVTINISPTCPDGGSRPISRPVLCVEFSSVDEVWVSGITLNPEAPNLVFNHVVGGNVIDIEEQNLDIDIGNAGGMDCTELTAELVALNQAIIVTENNPDYPAINAGESSRIQGEVFRIDFDRELAIPGSIAEMLMVLQSEDDFIDTLYFEVQLAGPQENSPQGPDLYGYICYDDTDQDWNSAPEYNWIEISRRENDRDFNGVECEFTGQSPYDLGESQVIDLGFTTQFYGEEFDRITVCTNGFIAMGSQERITNFQNWPLDRTIGGGVGMVAPLWDNLRFTVNSQVYYYLDEELHYFLVEWYKVQHRNGGGDDLTFEVIIYDKEHWETETGDPNILFQYKNVTNAEGNANENWISHTPFASVGISSPDGSTGISYTWNGEYPVTSAPLEDRRAILFGTSIQQSCSGFLFGRVADVESGRSLEGAAISTNVGLNTRTDEEGTWSINRVPNGVDISLTARKTGYNDSTISEINLDDNERYEINFNLLHPEFSPSRQHLDTWLDFDMETDLPLRLRNSGNGTLEWEVECLLPGNAHFSPYQFRESYTFGDSINGADVEAVIFVDSLFYLAASNRSMIYVLDKNGSLVNSFLQPVEGNESMVDLAWDGHLIWGGENDPNRNNHTIYGFTTEGEVESTFEGPDSECRSIAYDPDRECLWIYSWGENISAYRRDGEQLQDLELEINGFYPTGLAYWSDDPDGCQLYAVAFDWRENVLALYKFNIQTGECIRVSDLVVLNPGYDQSGAFITSDYDNYSVVLMNISKYWRREGYDRVNIWQIERNINWYSFETENDHRPAESGVIQAGQFVDFTLQLDASDLQRGFYELNLDFWHNAVFGYNRINALLQVSGPAAPFPFDLIEPENHDTLHTKEIRFTWEPSFEPNEGEQVIYRLWIEANDDSVSYSLGETEIALSLDTLGIVLIPVPEVHWWVWAVSEPDSTPCNNRFSFYYSPTGNTDQSDIIPYEFEINSIFPNPFNSTTMICYELPEPGDVSIKVYNLSGQQITTLFEGFKPAGFHSTILNSTDMPSGLYFMHLIAGDRTLTRKVMLIR